MWSIAKDVMKDNELRKRSCGSSSRKGILSKDKCFLKEQNRKVCPTVELVGTSELRGCAVGLLEIHHGGEGERLSVSVPFLRCDRNRVGKCRLAWMDFKIEVEL